MPLLALEKLKHEIKPITNKTQQYFNRNGAPWFQMAQHKGNSKQLAMLSVTTNSDRMSPLFMNLHSGYLRITVLSKLRKG